MVSSISWVKNGPQPYNVVITLGFDATRSVSVDIDNNVRGLLTPQQRQDPAIVSATASDWIQMLIDAGPPGQSSRELLSGISGSPEATTDPGRPDYFWARVDHTIGNGASQVQIFRPTALVGGTATHLIGRAFLATVFWDGTNFDIGTATPPNILR